MLRIEVDEPQLGSAAMLDNDGTTMTVMRARSTELRTWAGSHMLDVYRQGLLVRCKNLELAAGAVTTVRMRARM